MKNLQKFMKQAQEMQAKFSEMQARLEEEETEGASGGGMVKITLNGKGLAKAVRIDPTLLDPKDAGMLEDLLVAAINDARAKVDDEAVADAREGLSIGVVKRRKARTRLFECTFRVIS